MGYRKYITFLVFIISYICANAQENTFAKMDSVSYSLYKAGNWDKLIKYGSVTVAGGGNFPLLRLRTGYACFVTENYKAALAEYEAVLKQDRFNQTARYFAYYCNKYLNNDAGAGYHARYIDRETLSKENVSSTGLTDVAFETGLKMPENMMRGTGTYTRLGLSNRLGWRLQAEQSVAYFNQNIKFLDFDDRRPTIINRADNQAEYFIKLNYALTSAASLIGSYHYLNTRYLGSTYHSNLGLLGIKYAGRYTDLQGDVNFGSIVKQHTLQYNAKLTYYPLGNLNLYTISRASLKHTNVNKEFIFDQAFGFRLLKNTWLESSVTLGNLENYADADGLYIYNAIDNTKFKFGQTAYYQLSLHALLQLNYTYERKLDNYQALRYNQHAITAGIVWKF